jgi:hypothetical protein
MERRVAKLNKHVAVFDGGVTSFIGFGTIIKPNEPVSAMDIETLRRTTPIIKLVRHGTMTLKTFSRR